MYCMKHLKRKLNNDGSNFWDKKIKSAFTVRKNLGLTDNPSTNMYRLMHAEGDGIPGLIIDFYNYLCAFALGVANKCLVFLAMVPRPLPL